MKVIKLLIFVLFLTFSSHVLAETKCKYFSEADVINGELINKKDQYTCKENNQNLFVSFLTDPKWSDTVTMLFIAILETL